MKGKKNEAKRIQSDSHSPEVEFAIGYLYRCIEEDINSCTAAIGDVVSGQELAERMGTLLLAKARGEVLGNTGSVPALRVQTGTGNKAVESVEGHSDSHNHRPQKVKSRMSKAARERIAAAQRLRWRKQKAAQRKMEKKTKMHWTQTPAGRRK